MLRFQDWKVSWLQAWQFSTPVTQRIRHVRIFKFLPTGNNDQITSTVRYKIIVEKPDDAF